MINAVDLLQLSIRCFYVIIFEVKRNKQLSKLMKIKTALLITKSLRQAKDLSDLKCHLRYVYLIILIMFIKFYLHVMSAKTCLYVFEIYNIDLEFLEIICVKFCTSLIIN